MATESIPSPPSPRSNFKFSSVYTCVRLRPQLATPPLKPLKTYVESEGTSLRIVRELTQMTTSATTSSETKYSFDNVFDTEQQTKDVFETTWPKMWEALSEGFNTNICVYGQTGSGKTYTVNQYLSEMLPVLFTQLRESTAGELLVEMSYVQVYLDTLCDLLDGNKQVTIKCKSLESLVIHKAAVESPEDVKRHLTQSQRFRAQGAHLLNSHSSRAHTIFVLQMSFTRKSDGASFSPKLYVVDLAGSERNSRTQATGIRLEESCAINKSLSCLAKCLDAMSQKAQLIPYRESLLTLFLKDALSNTHFVLLCCVSSDLVDEDETRCTLQFATVARRIVVTRSSTTALRQRKSLRLEKEEETKRLFAEVEKQHQVELNALHAKTVHAQMNAQRASLQMEEYRARTQAMRNSLESKDRNTVLLECRLAGITQELEAFRRKEDMTRAESRLWIRLSQEKATMAVEHQLGFLRLFSASSFLEGPLRSSRASARSGGGVLPSWRYLNTDILSEITPRSTVITHRSIIDEGLDWWLREVLTVTEDEEKQRRAVETEEALKMYGLVEWRLDLTGNAIAAACGQRMADTLNRCKDLETSLDREEHAKGAIHSILMDTQDDLEAIQRDLALELHAGKLREEEGQGRVLLALSWANGLCALVGTRPRYTVEDLLQEPLARHALSAERDDCWLSLYRLYMMEETNYVKRQLRAAQGEARKSLSQAQLLDRELLAEKDTCAYLQSELDLTIDMAQLKEVGEMEAEDRHICLMEEITGWERLLSFERQESLLIFAEEQGREALSEFAIATYETCRLLESDQLHWAAAASAQQHKMAMDIVSRQQLQQECWEIRLVLLEAEQSYFDYIQDQARAFAQLHAEEERDRMAIESSVASAVTPALAMLLREIAHENASLGRHISRLESAAKSRETALEVRAVTAENAHEAVLCSVRRLQTEAASQQQERTLAGMEHEEALRRLQLEKEAFSDFTSHEAQQRILRYDMMLGTLSSYHSTICSDSLSELNLSLALNEHIRERVVDLQDEMQQMQQIISERAAECAALTSSSSMLNARIVQMVQALHSKGIIDAPDPQGMPFEVVMEKLVRAVPNLEKRNERRKSRPPTTQEQPSAPVKKKKGAKGSFSRLVQPIHHVKIKTDLGSTVRVLARYVEDPEVVSQRERLELARKRMIARRLLAELNRTENGEHDSDPLGILDDGNGFLVNSLVENRLGNTV